MYRPPGHTRSEKLPVVYATDGQMFAPYARRIDAAIAAGTIPRLVVVAAHSAGFDPAPLPTAGLPTLPSPRHARTEAP